MHRLGVAVLVLAGCRLHFDELAVDGPAAVALTCNVPIQLGDATATDPRLSAAATGTRIVASWIDDAGNIAAGQARMLAPDQVIGSVAGAYTTGGGYTRISMAATADVLLAAFATPSGGGVRLFDDATGTALAGPTTYALQVLGSHAATPTGASAPLFAVVGNSLSANRSQVVGVNRDGSVGTPLDSGNVNTLSTITNVETRLAIVDIPPTDDCEAKTADLAVTNRTTTVAWGTTGQCTEGIPVFSPGRSDALLVRHDLTDNDLNHAIATRSGNNYAIAAENRLRTPADEPRGGGVADGYWVAYETAGQLEAAHVDFAGTVGTVVPLGQVSSATGHDVVVKDGEAYAVWLGNGLQLVHLCP